MRVRCRGRPVRELGREKWGGIVVRPRACRSRAAGHLAYPYQPPRSRRREREGHRPRRGRARGRECNVRLNGGVRASVGRLTAGGHFSRRIGGHGNGFAFGLGRTVTLDTAGARMPAGSIWVVVARAHPLPGRRRARGGSPPRRHPRSRLARCRSLPGPLRSLQGRRLAQSRSADESPASVR